ncbi:MAG: 4Fe-4S binding protein [Firmicutes bacterium]|jgi:pyruvate ferredoxin oxidoreductase delta subunit|nr:4Fe-4S binding protein [Bacillota bacterium]
MSIPNKDDGWRDVPKAGRILEAGSAERYETGGWRTFRPKHIAENCINCLFCWIFCPDQAIIVEDGKFKDIDWAHCKGCGICAAECPTKKKAIVMVKEDEA